MKRFLVYCIVFILSISSIASHAADTSTEIEWTPKHVYGETENGLYVRTIMEEIEGCPSELMSQEMTAVKRARMMTELSEEMKEAGYTLEPYNDERTGESFYFALEPPNLVADGMNKETYYKKEMEKRKDEIPESFGYLYVSATVAPIIEETETDLFLTIEGVDVLGYYELDVLSINNYKTSTKLPVGTYKVELAGVKNDYKSEYPVIFEEKTFTIGEAGATLFTYSVGESVYVKENEMETETEAEIEETIETTKNKNISYTYTIIAYIVVGMIAVLLIGKYRDYKKQNLQ